MSNAALGINAIASTLTRMLQVRLLRQVGVRLCCLARESLFMGG
jgi:hypothetical protein